MPASDVTLTGNWTINQYTVTYYLDGVQDGETLTFDYNASVALKALPSKTGYTVSGWYTDEACTAEASNFTMPAENVKL